MAYIINNDPTILNIKLTTRGRELLSKGSLTFDNFVLGDSEIDYNLINAINDVNFSESILGSFDKNPNIISYIPQSSGGTQYNSISTVHSMPMTVENAVVDMGFFESINAITTTTTTAPVTTTTTHGITTTTTAPVTTTTTAPGTTTTTIPVTTTTIPVTTTTTTLPPTTTTTTLPPTTTTTTINPSGLTMTFSNFTAVSSVVGDYTNVNSWNTFFSLPAYGLPFTSVEYNNITHIIKLHGGDGILLKKSIFQNDLLNLTVFNDQLGVIKSAENLCFYNCNILTSVSMPSARTIGENCFKKCSTALNSVSLPLATYIADYAFNNCTHLTSVSFAAVESLGIGCFSGSTSITTVSMPALLHANDSCFDGLTGATSYNLPLLRVAGNRCFAFNTHLVSITLASIIGLGDYCFQNCTLLTTVNVVTLSGAGNGCFKGCVGLTSIVDMPLVALYSNELYAGCTHLTSVSDTYGVVTYLGDYCFSGCTALTTAVFQECHAVGNSCFYNCTSLGTVDLTKCLNLGSTSGNTTVFLNVKSPFHLTIRTSLTNAPDGDILYLQTSKVLTLTKTGINALILNFYDPLGVVSGTTYWNTFFDLPANGSPFTGSTVVGTQVQLFGGKNIIAKDNLFYNNQQISGIDDQARCVVSALTYSFSNCNYLNSICLPALKSAGDYCFNILNNFNSSEIHAPLLQTAGNYTFNSCYPPYMNYPHLTTAGNYCFAGYSGGARVGNFPSLTTAGDNCFNTAQSFILNLPLLSTIGTYCFATATNLESLSLPSLTTIDSPKSQMFNGCFDLLSINLPALVSIAGDWHFASCIKLRSISLPSTTTITATYMFSGCDLLYFASTPQLTSVPDYSFSCAKLSQINIPLASHVGIGSFATPLMVSFGSLSGITSAADSAFAGCASIVTGCFPLLSSVGQYCFQEWYSAVYFELPSLTTSSYGLFFYCSGMRTFYLPSLVNAVVGTFLLCTGATYFDLPSVTHVGAYCFSWCLSATNFNLPLCVNMGDTTGYDGVFNNINNLTINLVLPSSVMTNFNIWGFPGPDIDILVLQFYNNVRISHPGITTTTTTASPIKTLFIHIPNL